MYSRLTDSFDLGLNLPMNINPDSILRLKRSHFPGKEADLRFKALVSRGFAMDENDSMA